MRMFDSKVYPGTFDDHDDCNKIFCQTCKEYVEGPTHECFMKPTKESEYYVPTKTDILLGAAFTKKKKKGEKSMSPEDLQILRSIYFSTLNALKTPIPTFLIYYTPRGNVPIVWTV